MEFKEMPAKHPEADAKNMMCGSCQWFLAGFNGKNCQAVRGVKYNTAACKEFTLPLNDPYFHIIQDKYIQGIREVLASAKFKIDASILEELRSYIIDDDFTKFRFGTVQDLEAMNLSLKKIIQLRSRVSTIYTSMMDIKHEYEELQYHCQLWLVSKYEIIRDLKSEGLRKVITLRLLPEMINISKNIDKNIIVAKHIDDRLESNERTLSKILSSSEKLWFSRERVGGALKGVLFNE